MGRIKSDAHDESSWNYLLQEYSGIKALARRICASMGLRSSNPDVEPSSIAHGAWVRMAQSITNGRTTTIQNKRAWRVAVIRNEIRDRLRRAQSRRRLVTKVVHNAGGRLEMTDVSSFRVREEFQRCLAEVIARLPARDQKILALRYWENLSHEEISRTMDLTIHAVEGALYRAKKRIRENLA